MQIKTTSWIKISLLNLTIVALLGVIMRYKIGFEFPFLNQKYLQHSHSHFAFSGWVSQILMVFMVDFLQRKAKSINFFKRYNLILISNLICAYGMLVFFIIQGYGAISIFFSTASIFVAFWFAFYYFKDLAKYAPDSFAGKWFKVALLFNLLSTLGTFYLAYMMASKNVVHNIYLSSVYFYLHFQYNGWFLFACFGLFFDYFKIPKTKTSTLFFNTLTLSCIPTFGLSILWLKLPKWLYIVVVIFAVIQTVYWFSFLYKIYINRKSILISSTKFLNTLLVFIGIALSLKFILQLGTTIPELGKLAFGFRTIVIAYLHLVLLAIISLFLLYYAYSNFGNISKNVLLGLKIFFVGVVLNELILAIQGFASFSYTLIPFTNEFLFIAAIILFGGILIQFLSFRAKK